MTCSYSDLTTPFALLLPQWHDQTKSGGMVINSCELNHTGACL
jgi:hypothetical protein